MERSHQISVLFDQHRITIVARQHLDPRSCMTNDRCPNEHRFEGPGSDSAFKFGFRREPCDAAVDLPAVGVALHVEIYQPEALLLRTGHMPGHQDGPGTGSEDRLAVAEGYERLEQPLVAHQLEHGGAFAAGDHQPGNLIELAGFAHVDRLRPQPLQHRPMSGEIPLQGKYSDLHYQPRTCNSSDSGSLAISRPGMASPSSRLASRSLSGSLKFLAAFTMAFARASGSDDLKIPEPT